MNEIPENIYRQVLARDDYSCVRCGAESNLTTHHIVYRSQGGSHTLTNLVTLCWKHHRDIHDGRLKIKLIQDHFYFREVPWT